MDILLGKVSRALKKIVCSENIKVFTDKRKIDLTNSIAYSPHSTLDEDQWFFIKFSDVEVTNPIKECSAANGYDWVQVTREEYSSIRFLILIDKLNKRAFYQKIPPSLLINKPKLGFFLLNDEPTIVTDPIILLNDVPDAIYDQSVDKLYFRYLSKLTDIFSGIDQLFKIATEEQVSDFVNSNIFNTGSGFDVKKVSTPIRKKITLVKDRYEKFSGQEQAQFIANVQSYLPHISLNNGKFLIKSNEDVRDLADALDQRFHNTPITNEPRRTQSYQTLK